MVTKTSISNLYCNNTECVYNFNNVCTKADVGIAKYCITWRGMDE